MRLWNEAIIVEILRDARPKALDQVLAKTTLYDKGRCDQYNDIVVACAAYFYPDDGTGRATFTRKCIETDV